MGDHKMHDARITKVLMNINNLVAEIVFFAEDAGFQNKTVQNFAYANIGLETICS